MAKLEWSSSRIYVESALEGSLDYLFVSTVCYLGSEEERFKQFKKRDFHLGKLSRLKCLKCGATKEIPGCSNCDNATYHIGVTNDRRGGLFCTECDKGFTSWKCKECGTENPVTKTIESLDKSGCFIATAVYESYEAPEVIILRRFRDDILNLSKVGQLFVKFYYFFSPPIAKFLSNKSKLKVIVREKILTPFVKHIENKLGK